MLSTENRNIPALLALIEKRAAIPFGWRNGRDCASFAARAIKAQTGIDARGQLRWKNRREAVLTIEAEGGLEKAMDRRLTRVPLAMAQRGDIAAVPDPVLGIRLMVIEGALLVGPGASGLERQPRGDMVIAWDTMSVRHPVEGER